MRSGARLAAGLALGLTMIVTLTVGFFWAVQRQSEANRQVIRTHQVLENLESAISLLKDAETGQRGFLLTGQDQYLDPYNAATKSIKQKLDAVGDLTKDNPAQEETLQRVRAMTADKLAELAKRSNCAGSAYGGRPGGGPHRPGRADHGRHPRRRQQHGAGRTATAGSSHRCGRGRQGKYHLDDWRLDARVVAGAGPGRPGPLRIAGFGGPGEPSPARGRKWASIAGRYGSAVIAVAVAVVLARLLVAAFGDLPTFVTFYPAVLLVATLGGGGPDPGHGALGGWRPITGSSRRMGR